MITKRIGRTLLFYFSCLNFGFWRGRIMKLIPFYVCFVESWLVLFIFKEYRKCVKAFTTLCEIYRLNVKSFSAKQHQMKNTDFLLNFIDFFVNCWILYDIENTTHFSVEVWKDFWRFESLANHNRDSFSEGFVLRKFIENLSLWLKNHKIILKAFTVNFPSRF